MWIVLVLIGCALLAYGLFAPSREKITEESRQPKRGNRETMIQTPTVATTTEVKADDSDIILYERREPPTAPPVWEAPSPNGAVTSVSVPEQTNVADWPTLIDEQARDANETTRSSMIRALGALSMPWCAPILARAHDQETTLRLRVAVIAAIRDGRYVENEPTLAIAMRSASEQERIVAVEALAAIGRYAKLEDALLDLSLPVASSAAYLLLTEYGRNRVMELLSGRPGSEDGAEIRKLLAIVS